MLEIIGCILLIIIGVSFMCMIVDELRTNYEIRKSLKQGSDMNGINVDDLMSAIDRLNKVPDYNDLLKENKELKKQLEDANEKILLLQASEPMLNYKKALEETQQKEFINYLEDEIKRLKENDIYQPLQKMALATHEHILQKYKSIIGDDK